jgi:hypothetical protein
MAHDACGKNLAVRKKPPGAGEKRGKRSQTSPNDTSTADASLASLETQLDALRMADSAKFGYAAGEFVLNPVVCCVGDAKLPIGGEEIQSFLPECHILLTVQGAGSSVGNG